MADSKTDPVPPPGDKTPPVNDLYRSKPPAITVLGIYAIGGLLWGGYYLLKNPQKAVTLGWWWVPIGVIVAAVLLLLFLPKTRTWMERLSPTKRAVFVIYILIPLLVVLVASAAVFLAAAYQANVMRIVFLGIVILLPATMYYLFVATRKVSLLNEFINNLDRLGLLSVDEPTWTKYSADEQRLALLRIQRRFESYRKKFEALYGPVSDEDLDKALDATAPDGRPASMPTATDPSRTGSLFTSEMAVPVVAASILVALGWILILPLQPRAPMTKDYWLEIMKPQEVPVYFAFLGAYFFSLQMLFRRYVLRDLRPSAYVAVSMRIILAVVGTWVVAVAARYKLLDVQPDTLLIVGFVIGVFPSLAWEFVQAALKKVLFAGFFIPSLKTQLPISDLDGLTVWHEARLEEEDVENIPNMATADLVDLMLQTRFSSDRIIDWVDQAILYTHIGPEDTGKDGESTRKQLRKHGIRTATSLVETYRRAHESEDVDAFEKILALPHGGRSPVRGLADAVQTNPNFRTIWIWRNLPDEEYKNVTTAPETSTAQPSAPAATGDGQVAPPALTPHPATLNQPPGSNGGASTGGGALIGKTNGTGDRGEATD